MDKEIEKEIDAKKLKESYIKILVLFSPAIPHFSSECFEDLGYNGEAHWPKANLSFVNKDKIDYVIQINGKKRATIKNMKNISEEELINQIKNFDDTKKILEGKKIKKSFFVKNRLINILI